MTKPLNFRPILLCALSLLLGVLLFNYHPTLGEWTVVIPLILALIIFIIFFIVVEKDKRFTVAMTVVFCLLFLFIGMTSFSLSVKSIEKSQVESGSYTVIGEVKECTYNDGRYTVILDGCSYDGKDGGRLYVNGFTDKIQLYDILEIECYVYPYQAIGEKEISKSVKSNRVMCAYEIYEYSILGKANTLPSKFKQLTDRIFESVLGENAGILSALIRGDVSEMKENVKSFRVVGIAHIFAVSGMHVGLLFTAISFLLKKVPLSKWLKVITTCSILFLYSYLCGFSASSLRAAIMCSCLVISGRLGEKHDRVNALAEAFIIIVIFSPVEIFSVGFILSFIASFSIIILAPPIKRLFSFLPQAFSDSLGVLIATQISVLPLSVYYFGGFSFASFFANFILLPIVSVIFYLTVIGLTICLILPINELIALFVPKVLVLGAQGITNILSLNPIVLEKFPFAFSTVYYGMLFSLSDLFNFPKKFKIICAVGIILIILVAKFAL